MTARTPPRLAHAVLKVAARRNEALVGDVLEQFDAGRSAAWYWRQALYVSAIAACAEVRTQAGILLLVGIFAIVTPMMVSAALQQAYRHSADYPQITMAEDAATRLMKGGRLSAVVPTRTIDMQDSLDPFLIVFDDRGMPVRGSVTLNGRIPVPPQGVFVFARRNAIEHRFTWQPMKGVRTAAVVRHYGGDAGGGFVLAGRSLREIDGQIAHMTRMVMIAWLGSLTCLFAWFRRRTRETVA